MVNKKHIKQLISHLYLYFMHKGVMTMSNTKKVK